MQNIYFAVIFTKAADVNLPCNRQRAQICSSIINHLYS